MTKTKKDVLEQKKEIAKFHFEETVEVAPGVRGVFKPVAHAVIRSARAKYPMPKPPWKLNKDTGNQERDDNDPEYIADLNKWQSDISEVTTDAYVQFGLDLIDPLPDRSEWMPVIDKLSHYGHIDIKEFDLDSQLDLEFLYKKFVIGTAKILTICQNLSDGQYAEVERQINNFRGQTE